MENKEPSVEPILDEILLDIQKISISCGKRLSDLSARYQHPQSEAREQMTKFDRWMKEVDILNNTQHSIYSKLKKAPVYGEPIKKLLIVHEHTLGN